MTDDQLQTQALASDTEQVTLGDVLVGRFQLRQHLGQGAHGKVYLAKDLQLNCEVAVKLLAADIVSDPRRLQQFRNELLVSRRISHPNVLRVHEFYQDGNHFFYTMDLVDGVSLSQKCSADGRLDEQELINIVKQLMDAIEAAHQQQVLHCDIKPDNVLVDDNEQIFLCDFGVAACSNQASGNHFGSPSYCAPEYQQSGKASIVSDLYALGVTIYQLGCAELPFSGADALQLLTSKQQGLQQSQVVNKLPKPLIPLVSKLLSPYPEQRPQSIAEARSLLLAELNGIDAKAPTDKYKWQVVIIGVVIAVIATGLWLAKSPNQSQPIAENQSAQAQPAASSIKTITVLPFVDIQGASVTLSTLGQTMLEQQLKNERLHLVDITRLRQTLDFLNYQLPLSEFQQKKLAELLSADYLIQGQYTVVDDDYHVTLNLIDTSHSPPTSTELISELVEQSELPEFFSRSGGQIKKKLASTSYSLTKQQVTAEREYHFSQAYSDYLNNKFDAALAQAYQMIQQHPDYLAPYLLVAKIAQDKGDWLEAETNLQFVIEKAKPNSSEGLLAQAQLAWLQNDLATAEKFYLQLIEARPLDSQLRMELVNLFASQSKFSEAIEQLKMMVELDPQDPNAWFELSKMSIKSGDIQQALDEYLVKALVINRKIKNRSGESRVLNAFGVAYQRQGRIDEAEEYYFQALNIRKQLNNQADVAKTLSNIAALQSVKGNFSQAQEYLQQVLNIAQELNDIYLEGQILQKMGNLAEDQNYYAKALDYYRSALDIHMQLEDPWLKAEGMNNVGYIYFLLSDIQHAITYLQQAKQLYLSIKDSVGIIAVRQSLAQIYLQQGDWNQAYQALTTTVNDAQALELEHELFVARAYLGMLSYYQGQFGKSESAWQEALNLVEQWQDQRGIIEFSLWLAELNIVKGKFNQAKSLLDKCHALTQDTPNSEQALSERYLRALIAIGEGDAVKSLAIYNELKQSLKDNPLPELQLKLALLHNKLSLTSAATQLLFQQQLSKEQENLFHIHAIDYLYWLELQGHYAISNKDWQGVVTVLNKALPFLRRMGDYWRQYQFDAMAYEMKVATERPGANSNIYQDAFDKIVQRLPEAERAAFIQQNQYQLTMQQ